MQIIIPMAGDGSRFPKSKYPKSKPLIKIKNKPMIYHSIKSLGLNGKYFFLIRNNEHADELVLNLRNIVDEPNIKLTDTLTKGPASSCLLFENLVDLNDELIIANCDQIMWWNPEQFLSSARNHTLDGLVVTYSSDTEKNSYAKINNKGFITEIKEKEVISNISLNGIHYWKKAKYFFESASEMIKNKDTAPNGEYYVGPSYNYLISEGLRIGIHHIPNCQHHPVGVPEDLDNYLKLIDKV